MIVFPNCKINIGLDVIRRRPDGYHDIETVMYPVYGLYDSLEIIRNERGGTVFTTSGLPVGCDAVDNLVMRAYELLRSEYGIGAVRMHLHKNIPSGAGLGGGSSDAAFAVKALDSLFGMEMTREKMESFCYSLGSDVPFFIRNTPQLCSGRGEIMTPVELDLTGKYIAVINPGIHISTAEAYAGITTATAESPLSERISSPIEEWTGKVENTFEKTIFVKHPKIGMLKKSLYSCKALYALMTGSGSALYGIFENNPSCISTIYEDAFIMKI